VTSDEAYRILGVEPGASPKEVQLAYRERALERHPDRASSADEAAAFTRRFMEVRDAYEHLRRAGFPVPEPQTLVNDPPQVRTYERNFGPKKGEHEEMGTLEKLGLNFEVAPETIVIWGILIPGGVVLLVLFLRFLIRVLHA